MSVTAPAAPAALEISLDRLFIPDNVRVIDEDSLASMKRSIQARRRVINPVVVIDADPGVHGDAYDYVLVAGFRRALGSKALGLETIPAVYGDPEHEDADRALENIARQQLNPYEEAVAVAAMLRRGHTEKGAAEMLGWDQRRVTARMKLLELPERAQQLVGDGTIPLAAVEPMRVIAATSPELLSTVVAHIDETGDDHTADRLAGEPLRALGLALDRTGSDVFFAPLHQVPLHDLEDLALDDATLTLLAEAGELEKKINPWNHYLRIPFTDAEVDRARAAGVLIEIGDETPVVTDAAVFSDLCATAIAAAVETLRERVTERAERAAADKQARKTGPAGERAQLEADHRRAIRQLAEGAHAANLDLGTSLRDGLSTVDPGDMDVARLFVYGLLGRDPGRGNFYSVETNVSAIALRGIRLVIGEFREDVTKTRKDGSKGALRIVYGDGRTFENQTHWLWEYLDGARTAGELYGRALVVIAAERYASRLVVPSSQQREALSWPSHKDMAIRALEKLAKPHLAPTLKALQKAVAKAEREYESQIKAQREAQSAARGIGGTPSGLDPVDDDDVDDLDDFEGCLEEEAALDANLASTDQLTSGSPEAAPGTDAPGSAGVSAKGPGNATQTDSAPAGTVSAFGQAAAPTAAGTASRLDAAGDDEDVVDASAEIDF